MTFLLVCIDVCYLTDAPMNCCTFSVCSVMKLCIIVWQLIILMVLKPSAEYLEYIDVLCVLGNWVIEIHM